MLQKDYKIEIKVVYELIKLLIIQTDPKKMKKKMKKKNERKKDKK